MKALRIPLFVLLALLVLSLGHSAALARKCAQWTDAVDAAERAASSENWAEADRALSELRESWESCRLWLRVTLSQTTLDEAEMLMDQARLMGQQQEVTHMRAALRELRALLDRIEGGERLSLANTL